MDSGGNKLYLSDVCVMRKVDSEQTLETNEPASSSKEGYVLDLLCCTTWNELTYINISRKVLIEEDKGLSSKIFQRVYKMDWLVCSVYFVLFGDRSEEHQIMLLLYLAQVFHKACLKEIQSKVWK